MARVILYIAVSLAGYIARADGSVDFLQGHRADWPGDYGYQDFISGFGQIGGLLDMPERVFFASVSASGDGGVNVVFHDIKTSRFVIS